MVFWWMLVIIVEHCQQKTTDRPKNRAANCRYKSKLDCNRSHEISCQTVSNPPRYTHRQFSRPPSVRTSLQKSYVSAASPRWVLRRLPHGLSAEGSLPWWLIRLQLVIESPRKAGKPTLAYHTDFARNNRAQQYNTVPSREQEMKNNDNVNTVTLYSS